MAKRLTVIEKKEIISNFSNGMNIDQLSKKFKCTKLTIVRNLKKNLDEKEYHFLINKNKSKKNNESISENQESKIIENHLKKESSNNLFNDSIDFTNQNNVAQSNQDQQFMEILPLEYQINNEIQRDLSSVPLTEIDLPKTVYMIVDKQIELEIKLLNDYPEWQFLSSDELSRKTIQIYFDLKIAKRFCNKEQKVIKVPNTNVFKITSNILLSRGITRIVSPENLIAL